MGLDADHKNSFGAQGPPSGMGVTKAHSCSAEGIGLYGSPGGESIAPGAAVRTLDEGFDSFRFVPVLLAFGGCSPLCWQPPKASRTETMDRRPFVLLFVWRCTKNGGICIHHFSFGVYSSSPSAARAA